MWVLEVDKLWEPLIFGQSLLLSSIVVNDSKP